MQSNQATLNIGTIGHVAHGKTTLVQAISGTHTIKFKKEMEKNITIKLGYANAKIYRSVAAAEGDNSAIIRGVGDVAATESHGPHVGSARYESHGSAHVDRYFSDTHQCWMELYRHVSFVDCPGHDILMSTMLSGSSIMDAALLLVAANEPCPQPQTFEHIAAMEIMNLENIIIVQNKIDLLSENEAVAQSDEIRAFIKGTIADDSPIIPISAQLNYNIDYVLEYICSLPMPMRDAALPSRMTIVRSFDINKPGSSIQELKGGILGGSIIQGTLAIGDEIEIRPGIIISLPANTKSVGSVNAMDGTSTTAGRIKCVPIRSTIISLNTEKNKLSTAGPGGLIGVGTYVDPCFTRADRLVGHVLGRVGTLPPVYSAITVKYRLLSNIVGSKDDEKVAKLFKNECVLLNIGSNNIKGHITARTKDTVDIELAMPVCTAAGDKITISRDFNKHYRLIGCGIIIMGVKIDL